MVPCPVPLMGASSLFFVGHPWSKEVPKMTYPFQIPFQRLPDSPLTPTVLPSSYFQCWIHHFTPKPLLPWAGVCLPQRVLAEQIC